MEDIQEDPDWRTEEFESCLRMRPYEEIREMRAREAQLILNGMLINWLKQDIYLDIMIHNTFWL